MHIYYNIAPTDKSRASVMVYACQPLLQRTRDHEHPYIMSTEVIITSVDVRDGTDARITQYIFKASKLTN